MKPRDLYRSNLIDDDWTEIGVVRHPARRICSHLALCFVVAAIGADTMGKSLIGAGLHGHWKYREAINRANEYAEIGLDELAFEEFDHAASLEEFAHLKFHRAGLWGGSGMGLFVLAFGSFGLARLRREASSAIAFLLLAIAYVLLFMMMV
jgi:hypothetical protein